MASPSVARSRGGARVDGVRQRLHRDHAFRPHQVRSISSGYVKVDRRSEPHRSRRRCRLHSKTYCGAKVAALCQARSEATAIAGYLVLSSGRYAGGDLVPARVVGLLQLLDRGEPDDKISPCWMSNFVGAMLPSSPTSRRSLSSGCSIIPDLQLVPGAKPRSRYRACTRRACGSRGEAALEDYQAPWPAVDRLACHRRRGRGRSCCFALCR